MVQNPPETLVSYQNEDNLPLHMLANHPKQKFKSNNVGSSYQADSNGLALSRDVSLKQKLFYKPARTNTRGSQNFNGLTIQEFKQNVYSQDYFNINKQGSK
jgi:hypothetical protein